MLGLVAHDAKKADLLRLVRAHIKAFRRFHILATGTTGHLLQEETGLVVESMASGPLGGDLQLGSRIVEDSLDALIFLRDPLTSHPHEPDIQALLKACDVHQVPVATNVSTAEILLHFFSDYERQLELCGSSQTLEERSEDERSKAPGRPALASSPSS